MHLFFKVLIAGLAEIAKGSELVERAGRAGRAGEVEL